MARIIVKSGYMKGQKHKEYYVGYIATRDGVETYTSDGGEKPSTKKQIKMISQMENDFPSLKELDEYEDYQKSPTRANASALISAGIDFHLDQIVTKENYIDYISHRPRVEKLGEHGLFSDAGVNVNLNEAVKEVGCHQGNVWTHIISLKREDASRLGYDQAKNWMALCQSKRNELANAMKISPENLRWYAAFHNEGHHPHIHMVVYSSDSKEGYLTSQGIHDIRKMFASEIFKNDLLHIYKKQTEARDELKKFSREKMTAVIDQMNQPYHDDPVIFEKIIQLKESLKDYHGRLMYAYIPKNAKQLINDIVRQMEKDQSIRQLYEQWLLYKKDIVSTYGHEEFVNKLPLFEQKEFKSIKNMILKEVMKTDLDNFDLQLHDDDTDEQFNNISRNEEYRKYVQIRKIIREYEFDKIPDAIVWLENSNFSFSKYLLGKVYNEGIFVDRDINEAIQCFKECDKNPYSEYQLFKIYRELDEMTTALTYLKDSADGGCDMAQFYLGEMLFYGDEFDKDIELGMEYLKKSADYRNMYAQYLLGKIYLQGADVVQDKELAMYYLGQSAIQGNENAIYLLEHPDSYQNQSLSYLTARFFHHAGRIIQNNYPLKEQILSGVEHRLKLKILKKRSALGHKEDDHSLRF